MTPLIEKLYFVLFYVVFSVTTFLLCVTLDHKTNRKVNLKFLHHLNK